MLGAQKKGWSRYLPQPKLPFGIHTTEKQTPASTHEGESMLAAH